MYKDWAGSSSSTVYVDSTAVQAAAVQQSSPYTQIGSEDPAS